MLERNIIEEKVIEIIKSDKNLKDKEVSLSTELVYLGFNSIRFVQLAVAIEQKFGIEFDDEKLNISQFKTVKSIVDYLVSLNIE